MTLICFVYVRVQPMLYPHSKTAWEYCLYSFLSEAFGDACFLMDSRQVLQVVVDAFYRIYGVDIKRAGALNMNDLDVEKIG